MSHARRIAPLVAALLTACSAIGPDYHRPIVPLPASWQQPLQAASAVAGAASATAGNDVPPIGAAALTNTAWWSAFGDPQLDALIRVALDENKDLRIAAYRVDQFNAQLQVAQSAGLPQASGSASRTRDAVSQNRFIPLVSNAYPVGNNYEFSGSVNWELDVWGKIRRANEAAMADLLASEENRRAVLLSLVANVATTYLSLLSLDRETELHRNTVASRDESLQLLVKKLAGGGVNELPVLKARAELEEARADLTVKETDAAVLEHALSGLLGRNPGPIERGRPIEALTLPAIPAALPAELLAQRPDVRKAEQDLIAANARIGVAKGQYFPTIGLTAQSGYASAELSQLAQSSSNFGSFGAQVLGPLFTAGRIAGQVREAEAVQHEKEIIFLQQVQTALREVEDALVAHRNTWQRLGIRSRQLAALREHRQSAFKRFEDGGSSYLEVLDADRNLYAGEIQQNQTRRDEYIALINVYKAMGGGWSLVDYPVAPLPPTLAKATSP